MSVDAFFQYLLRHDATRQLAIELAAVHMARTRLAQRRPAPGRFVVEGVPR